MPPRKSSTGSSDGKKQTTLSSFFKKASATPKPAKVRPGSEVVGKRLKVWWPADGAWYAGRVASLTAGGATHEVRYDDGDVDHLVAHSKCRALFATHYHDLVASWAGHADVQLGHMDCLVDPESDTVVFLYKLTDGCSPKSFGINVAKLAKLPKKVLDRAAAKSAEFEAKLKAKSQAK